MTDKTVPYIYDQVPYPSLSFAWTHPDHLATIATLLGMLPPPVEHCRVLELGCASGGNLIPMAYGLPGSEFVGIDLSALQIDAGQATITALDLPNIELKHMDIMEIEADFGQFDYIIAHGVYSWVPPAAQDKILKICRQNLAPDGVAYISYNTYPGWRMLGTVRDMMLFHTRQLTEPQARVREARALIQFLAETVPAKHSPHASFLNAYLSFVNDCIIPKNDEFLLHDELEAVNEPIYFYQFAERAARHGLQYLAEAEFQGMLASNLPAEVSATLRQMAKNTVELEQYMDFLRNRAFRQTLLCHQGTRLGGAVTPERLANFYVASSARPEAPEPDIRSITIDKFRAYDGSTLSIDHPLTKMAMIHLGEIWPKAIPFKTLLAKAQARLDGAGTVKATTGSPSASPDQVNEAQVLGANLLKAFSYSEKLVELHVYAPEFVLDPSERPVASPVARIQAQGGPVVTNLRHERVDLEGTSRYFLLPHLDGSRDQAALLAVLEELVAKGTIKVDRDDESIGDASQNRQGLDEMLESDLRQLANAALLVS